MTPPKKIGRPFKYPWLTVEVGEFFFVTGRSSTSLQHDAVKHRPRRYRCKKIMTKGVIGIKVTRVS